MGISGISLLAESSRKLDEKFRRAGFNTEHVTQTKWKLFGGNGSEFFVRVRRHDDGREADYSICTKKWIPIQ